MKITLEFDGDTELQAAENAIHVEHLISDVNSFRRWFRDRRKADDDPSLEEVWKAFHEILGEWTTYTS